MITIKRDYYDETKEILKKCQHLYYGFSICNLNISEHKKEIVLNDNNKTTFIVYHDGVIVEVLNALMLCGASIYINYI